MKLLSFLLLLCILVYGIWAYLDLFRLNHAVVYNNQERLNQLIDIQALREEMKRNFNQDVGDGPHPWLKWFADGVQRLNSETLDRLVTIGWVRDRLLSKIESDDSAELFAGVSYAFFESPTRLLVRYGELGQDPIHLYLQLYPFDFRWRVNAMYQ